LTAARKLPLLEPLSEFFWTSGADGRLRIQHCKACGHYQHPPLVRCGTCHSAKLAPKVVSGRGTVKSWTVNHQPWQKGVDPTFIFAAIELAEQAELYVLSNVLCAPDGVRSGMPVRVTFERQDDVWIPLFAPVAPGRG
jgi:uncharacterized OB-fold protein